MNINEHIKKISLKHTIYPAIVIIIALTLFIILPFTSTFNPYKLDDIWSMDDANHKGEDYATVTINHLYYTGYDLLQFGHKDYSYYYCLNDNKCVFVIIPKPNEPSEVLDKYTVSGKIIHGGKSYRNMLSSLAEDLGWSKEGLNRSAYPVVLSTSAYHPGIYAILFILLIGGFLVSLYLITIHIIHYLHPYTYIICPHTDNDERKRMIKKAQYELENNLVISAGSMHLTEHYFIDMSKHRIVILPIMRIIWGYRMGTLNVSFLKKLPSYNLYFTLKSGDVINLTHKSSEDSSAILNVLKSLDYGIVLGYTEGKRKKAKNLIKK